MALMLELCPYPLFPFICDSWFFLWLTLRFWPWAWEQLSRCHFYCHLCTVNTRFPLIVLLPSFPLWRSFIFIRKMGTKRHWGACILCLWLVSSKQPTSSSWSLFGAELKKPLSSFAIFQVSAILGLALLMLCQFTPLFCLVPLSR